jgi:hypothetical protein
VPYSVIGAGTSTVLFAHSSGLVVSLEPRQGDHVGKTIARQPFLFEEKQYLGMCHSLAPLDIYPLHFSLLAVDPAGADSSSRPLDRSGLAAKMERTATNLPRRCNFSLSWPCAQEINALRRWPAA